MASPSYEQGGGRVPIAVLAADAGQTVPEAKRSLADMSAFGIVRLALGPEGETTRVRVTRYLSIIDEDGTSGCHALFLAQPAPALAPSRRRRITEAITGEPGLPLGSVALLCAAMRLADRTGFAASAAIEDYLGWPRGAMDKGEGERLDP